MFAGFKKYAVLAFVLLLVCAVLYIVYLDVRSSYPKLTFAMLDVGQGDALFVESPTGTQIMFDGGPSHQVLSPLSRVMPYFDRSIDALVITNPDADHIAGFLDVLKNYKVKAVLLPGTWSSSKVYLDLKNEIKKQNIPNFIVGKGMRLNLGGGVVVDILFPDRDVVDWSTNDGSVVAKLSYEETSVMLTGDSSAKTEQLILKNNKKENLKSSILKVGHHGSKTSTTWAFVEALAPEYALISDGEANKYGHPHSETLKTLTAQGVKVLRTDLSGSIIMHSDGKTFNFSFKK